MQSAPLRRVRGWSAARSGFRHTGTGVTRGGMWITEMLHNIKQVRNLDRNKLQMRYKSIMRTDDESENESVSQ